MRLILRYSNGQCEDALLLMRGEALMRVILHNRKDTVELRLIADRWLDENGGEVSIEAILPEPYQGGRQTNTKYSTIAETPKTATAAMRLTMSGGMN